MHLKKFKFFSIAGQKHMWGVRRATNEQMHQQAPLTSLKTQNITVYEVEHQKTVNTKLGKQTIWFSEVIKEFYHYYQGK